MRLEAVPPIQSERLSLRWMSPRFIEASLSDKLEAVADALGSSLPDKWPDVDAKRRLQMRLNQIIEAPISPD